MKHGKLKILTVVAVIALLAVLFTACGKIDFTYVQRKDGTYQQIIDITLDNAQMEGTGYTVATAIPKLAAELSKEGYTVKTYDDNPSRITASRIFASLADMQTNYLGNGLHTDKLDTRNEAFYIYQDIDATAKISLEYMSGVASMWLRVTLLEHNTDNYEEVYNKMTHMDTSYSYATPYKSVTSNADSITKTSDGYYLHTWNLDDGADVSITLSTVRGAVWYAVAILVAVAAVAVFASVQVLGEKFKKVK